MEEDRWEKIEASKFKQQELDLKRDRAQQGSIWAGKKGNGGTHRVGEEREWDDVWDEQEPELYWPHQKYIQILIQSLVLPFSEKKQIKSITVYVTWHLQLWLIVDSNGNTI